MVASSMLVSWALALTGSTTGLLGSTVLSTWSGTDPCSTSPKWTGVTCTGTGAAAAVTALTLRNLALNGTLSCSVANVTTLLSIDVSLNSLTGSVPSCLAQNLGVLTLLNLAQNRLTGTLPPELPPNKNMLGLSVFDNQFSGTVPSSYASLSWLALAYNPGLIGSLPVAVGSAKLRANNATSFVACASGAAPMSGTGCLFGTSMGLDLPLTSILQDIRAAMDPAGVLSSWNASRLQPCPPYTGQPSSSPGYGSWWAGLYKGVAPANSTSYCQDVGALLVPATLFAPATFTALANPTTSATTPAATFPANTALVGGVSALVLNGLGLSGMLPVQLRELRTTSVFLLSRNALTGTLPSEWGTAVAWNNFNASAGFDACTLLDVGQNALNGTLPSSLGSIGTSGRAGLAVYDNQFSGSVPPSFASLSWVALAYNPLLVGALPAGVNSSKLFAWSGNLNGFYAYTVANVISTAGLAPTYSTGYLYGTSIGLDRPLPSILSDLRAALDPAGVVLGRWNASLVQPCPPWYPTGITALAGTGQRPASPGYGTWLPGVSKPGGNTTVSYCQDYYAGSMTIASVPFTLTAAATYTALTNPTFSATTPAMLLPPNARLAGGVSALVLNGLGLNGTLPVQLRELRTTTFFMLSRNALTGSIPECWCVRVFAAPSVLAQRRVVACAWVFF
jgi:hypothetical protein